MNLEFEVQELHRRLANLFLVGTIEETDYEGVVPRARVKTGDLITGKLPIVTLRAGFDKTSWLLDKGEQVLVLSMSGDPALGVILGSINQRRFPNENANSHVHRVEYQDHARVECDSQSHHYAIHLPEGATYSLVAEGGVSIKGDVDIDGSLTASNNISDKTRSMTADREIYNSHQHPGISPGKGSSLPPEQQQ